MSRSRKTGLTAAQDVLRTFVGDITQMGLPELGPEFKNLSGSVLTDALISYRIGNKFVEPSDADKERKQQSIQKMLAYDMSGPVTVPYMWNFPPGVDPVLFKARRLLHGWLEKCKTSNVVRFPTGEVYTSAKGYVDLYDKLKNLEYWEVSRSCLKDAATLAYQNLGLRKLVKEHFRDVMGAYGKRKEKEWFAQARGHVGFYCFFRKFSCIVKIVSVSRVTTVPKNRKEDRVITCEPLWNMMVQLSTAADLRASMLSQIGVDLRVTQQLHKKLISSGDATIDLSNASNSNWMCWLKFLWPQHVFDRLSRARTGMFEYELDGELHYAPVNMLAPMGCGFTFEVMTLTLLAICRSLDDSSSVFGDDIIIKQKHARQLTVCLEYMGWRINETKSFTEGNFRESCGAFYDLSTQSYLLSYDFLWPETIQDVFVIIQKMENLLVRYGVGLLGGKVVEAYIALIGYCPDLVFREYEVRGDTEFCEESVPTRLYRYVASYRDVSPLFECLRKIYQCRVIPYTAYKSVNKAYKPKACAALVACQLYTMTQYNAVSSRISDKVKTRTMLMNTMQPLRATALMSVI